MEQKYYEIFKLRYDKIINSSLVMYKTLASHNEMAFSSKKMLKETDQFIQAVLLNKAIKFQHLDLELLNQIHEMCNYSSLLKPLKLKKVSNVDVQLINKINLIIKSVLEVKPKFIKVALYFDKVVSNLELDSKVRGCQIILDSLNYMFALSGNKDDQTADLSVYEDEISIVKNYINRE